MRIQAHKEDEGQRLDQFLVRHMPAVSRARLQAWIQAGHVRVDAAPAKPSLRLRGHEQIELAGDPPAPEALAGTFAQDIPLEILYEDRDVAAILKPAGMTVHAGAGRREGTLVNALLHHFQTLSTAGGSLRPGIVHRLDRLTSGVLLVAKNDRAHALLAAQFAGRRVHKTYWALVHGNMSSASARKWGRRFQEEGVEWTRLEMPIRRDRRHGVRMTARAKEGRAALTDFRPVETWDGFSLLEVCIGTGRTHQIRVHLAAIGHPVVGDTLYGAPAQPGLPRIFLHALQISFAHPSEQRQMTIRAPLPQDLEEVLAALRAGRSELIRI